MLVFVLYRFDEHVDPEDERNDTEHEKEKHHEAVEGEYCSEN